MLNRKTKRRKGEKYVPSKIAKICNKQENKAVCIQDEHSLCNL